MRGIRVLAAVALLAEATSARAFVRLTTTPGHPETGLCLWWGRRQLTYKVNASGSAVQPCGDAAATVTEVQNAFPVWHQACTDFRFVFGGTTTNTRLGQDGINTVVFRSGLCANDQVVPATDPCRSTPGECAAVYNCWEHDTTGGAIDTLALTTNTFDTGTGEILDSDLELQGWNGLVVPAYGAYFTCAGPGMPTCDKPPYGQTGCNWVDVGDVVLHEAGHMLGLDHTCQYPPPYDACPADSVMTPATAPGSTRRTLSADDAAGICTVYPAGEPTRKCSTDSSGAAAAAPLDNGCSSGPAGPGALALLGLLSLALRARRARGARGART